MATLLSSAGPTAVTCLELPFLTIADGAGRCLVACHLLLATRVTLRRALLRVALLRVLRVVGLPALLWVLRVLWVLGVVALRLALLLRLLTSLRSHANARPSAFTDLSHKMHKAGRQ